MIFSVNILKAINKPVSLKQFRLVSLSAPVKCRGSSIAYKEAETRLKVGDGVSSDSQLVYRIPLGRYALYGKMAGWLALTAGTIGFGKELLMPTKYFQLTSSFTLLSGEDMIFFAVVSYIHAAVISYVLYKLPLRIYHNERRKEFTAILSSPLPSTYRRLSIAEKSVDRYVARAFDQYMHKPPGHSPLIIHKNFFRVPMFYNKMMKSKYTHLKE
jgi:hypothetical protein